MYIFEDIMNYSGFFIAVFLVLFWISGILFMLKKLDGKYVKFFFIGLSVAGVIMFGTQAYYVRLVKKQFKSDIIECKIAINGKILEDNASREVLDDIKKVREYINGMFRYGYRSSGYEIDLYCKTRNLKLLVEQSQEKEDIYYLFTNDYSRTKYVQLGLIRTKALFKYKAKNIPDTDGYQ